MQPTRIRRFAVATGLILAAVALGCGGSSTPPNSSPAPVTGYSKVSLTIACDDAEFAHEFGYRARAWSGRTGATVKVELRPADSNLPADVRLLRPTQLGGPASRKELAPFASKREGSNPLQWDRILEVYRRNLSSWGEEYLGLPVAGDAFVLVYRADRFAAAEHRAGFAAKYPQRPLNPPATWEDFAEVAAYFADAQKKPSLAPLPKDPNRLLTEFHQIAACYDRRAMADSDRGKSVDQGLGLHYRQDTGRSRLTLPAFLASAKWLADTRAYRPAEASDDPVAALDAGSAVLAVLSLAEVARLPKDPATGGVQARFQVAGLPGTRTYFDAAGQRLPAGRGANYVPYLGSGAWIGTVSKASPHGEAAWDMLAEAAGVAGSFALLSEPRLGAGPFRTEHLEDTRDAVWHGYQFDPERSKALANAIRHYVSQNVVNPALPLRTPDQASRMASLEVELRKAAIGQVTPEAALAAAAASWEKLDASQNPDERTQWRRNAAGLP